jgi:RNA polymerase sigma-70 factor (ECF subfamily)
MEGFNVASANVNQAAEKDLIARAQHGEEAAFEALFEAHKRRVYSVCLRVTRSPADAEDLTQEAFLKLFRKISTFRGDSAFSTWLHRLVVNEVLMHVRKKRVPQVSFDDEVNTTQGEPVRREYGHDDRRLMGCIDRVILKKAIAQLPTGYRTAFVLYELEGYTHNEIAKLMKWSIGNSKSQVFKARRKLRKLTQVQQWKSDSRPPEGRLERITAKSLVESSARLTRSGLSSNAAPTLTALWDAGVVY